MKENPQVNIAVTGGGSGTGITAIINGTTDIANSSREMKQKEKDDAKSKGIEVVENKVALDGTPWLLTRTTRSASSASTSWPTSSPARSPTGRTSAATRGRSSSSPARATRERTYSSRSIS